MELLGHKLERAVKQRRACTLLSAQIRITRTHGQTISLALGGLADHLKIEIQVRHHAPDDRQLLKILLAKHRHIRLHQIKQLGDNGGHADKMPRAHRAAQHV